LISLYLLSACGGSAAAGGGAGAGGAPSAGSSGRSGNAGALDVAGGAGTGGTNSDCVDTTCTASSSTATLTGTTENGPVSLSYAWKSQVNGFSHSVTLLFSNSATAHQSQCDKPSLSVKLDDPTVGVQNAVAFLLFEDGSSVDVAAAVTVDADDYLGNTSGKIDITSSGWDVHGTFRAPDCPELDAVSK
jgi:hypothetical protein